MIKDHCSDGPGQPSFAAATDRVDRRRFLLSLGAAGATTLVVGAGCDYYPAETGDAFSPWRFPGHESRPEHLAVGAAILAASPHNTQPWRFRISPTRIDLYADMDRSLGAIDGTHRELYNGLGCAVENLVIAARHSGRAAEVNYGPSFDDPTHVARVALAPSASESSPLFEAIARRRTNRGRYLDSPPPAGLKDALEQLIDEDPLQLIFIASDEGKRRVRDGIIEATEAINADKQMSEASHSWYRHTNEEIERHRDGITLDATGIDSATRFFGKSSGRPSAAEAGEYWLDGTREQQTTAAAFCMLASADRTDRTQQLRCGRAYQRIHLWATHWGLAVQPLSQMTERQDREEQGGFEPRFGKLIPELAGGVGGVQLIFRIGVAWDDAVKSPRRPIPWVTR